MRRTLEAVILSEACASRARSTTAVEGSLPPCVTIATQGMSILAFCFSYFSNARPELFCRRLRIRGKIRRPYHAHFPPVVHSFCIVLARGSVGAGRLPIRLVAAATVPHHWR